MSINVKKYTKDQMAKMMEDAVEKQEAVEAEAEAHFKAGVKLAEENEKLRGEIGTLTEQIDQMNGEAINKANEIANLKADADALQNKLADTEAALGMANAEADRNASALKRLHIELCNAAQRANYAEWHPWLNLWAWVKRELGYAK